MYLGKLVELANSEDIYAEPLHPYTQALLSAVPVPDPQFEREQIYLKGDIPSPANPPTGCTFHTRCPVATEICKSKVPQFLEAKPGHYVACQLVNEPQQ